MCVCVLDVLNYQCLKKKIRSIVFFLVIISSRDICGSFPSSSSSSSSKDIRWSQDPHKAFKLLDFFIFSFLSYTILSTCYFVGKKTKYMKRIALFIIVKQNVYSPFIHLINQSIKWMTDWSDFLFNLRLLFWFDIIL